jgi:transposase
VDGPRRQTRRDDPGRRQSRRPAVAGQRLRASEGTGCQWAYLPHDLPPKSATYYYFALWRDDGTDQAVHDLLRCQAREKAGRAEDPTAVVLDTQSIRASSTRSSTSGASPPNTTPARSSNTRQVNSPTWTPTRCATAERAPEPHERCSVAGQGRSRSPVRRRRPFLRVVIRSADSSSSCVWCSGSTRFVGRLRCGCGQPIRPVREPRRGRWPVLLRRGVSGRAGGIRRCRPRGSGRRWRGP